MLTGIIDGLEAGHLRAVARGLLGFVHLFDDGFLDAAEVLTEALGDAGNDVSLQTRLLITLAYAHYNAGSFAAAMRSIEDAVAHAERLEQPDQISQALAMRATLRFLRGDGLDETSLARALDLE